LLGRSGWRKHVEANIDRIVVAGSAVAEVVFRS
jgi:hypothetical protein